MSNKEPFSRKDCRKARNLAMFWEVRRDGLTQDHVAAKYGVSQQRVRRVASANPAITPILDSSAPIEYHLIN